MYVAVSKFEFAAPISHIQFIFINLLIMLIIKYIKEEEIFEKSVRSMLARFFSENVTLRCHDIDA